MDLIGTAEVFTFAKTSTAVLTLQASGCHLKHHGAVFIPITHTALSFKVEVMIYCPYPVQCEPGISFIFECQRVILLSKSVFLSFLSKKA